MVSNVMVQKLALAFDQTEDKPHFEKTSFRVKNKIFATLDKAKRKLVVKLSNVDQSVFSSIDRKAVFPVPGGWGKQGWTIIELKHAKKSLVIDALTTSYTNVAPKKLADKYLPKV